MEERINIAVDASGGEYAPHEIVKGAIKAAQEYNIQITLVGRKEILYVLAGRHLAKLGIKIIDAAQLIDFHESPIDAINNKPESSIVIGTNLVKDGIVNAFVSAGNTGAVLYSSLIHLGKIEGIQRPSIGSIIAINATTPILLLDSGANADCRSAHLVQFGQIGNIYAREIFGLESPRIGLLSNGEEDSKGNRLVKESFKLIQKVDLNFIGNVEGHDISGERTDVIVTDGFTGNIVLKTIEGLGDTFLKLRQVGQLLSKAYHRQSGSLIRDGGLGSLVRRMNYREYGGACLLGVNGNIIIAHGRSQAVAIKNAIGLAKRTAERDICQKIKEENFE